MGTCYAFITIIVLSDSYYVNYKYEQWRNTFGYISYFYLLLTKAVFLNKSEIIFFCSQTGNTQLENCRVNPTGIPLKGGKLKKKKC